MKRFYDILDRVLTFVLISLAVAMVFSITMEIVLNAFVQPSTSYFIQRLEASDPSSSLLPPLRGVMGVVATVSAPVNTASQTLLVWIGILGSALAFRYRAHLGVDALVRVYPPKVRLVLDYVSTALVGLFSLLVLVVGGYQVCYRAFSMGSKMPGFEVLNRGWFYLVLVFAGLLNLIYCVYHAVYPKPVGQAEREEKD
ncbi:TRAP transporter small permease subunit [bacterium]|nr:TRAP transporter small permease subunit [bacterium]